MSRKNLSRSENAGVSSADRLSQLLTERTVSRAALEQKIGVSAGYLAKIIRQQLPVSEGLATRIASAVRISRTWLLTGEGSSNATAPGVREAEAGYDALGLLNMPIVGQAAADETAGALRDLESVQSIYRSTAQRGLVKVLGGSMEPLARAGQYAVVDLSDRSAQNGDIVILETTDGRVLAKRYHEQDGRILLSGVNPVRPSAPVSLAPEQISQLRIVIGVLFE